MSLREGEPVLSFSALRDAAEGCQFGELREDTRTIRDVVRVEVVPHPHEILALEVPQTDVALGKPGGHEC